MNCQTTKDLLNGYSDGELDLINHLKIENHLRECSSCALEYKNLQTLKSVFLDDSMRFHASADLKKRIQRNLTQPAQEKSASSSWNWRWLTALAATFAIIFVLSLVFFQTRPANDELLAQEIVSAHIRSLMANHLTDVPSSDQHTVKPWFDGKLDFAPPVIDLTSQDFSLIGGRLDYAANRPVAALIYQRRQHSINLFIFPIADNSDRGNKMSVRQGYNLINWNKSGMTFWAVSDLNLSELQQFAQILQN